MKKNFVLFVLCGTFFLSASPAKEVESSFEAQISKIETDLKVKVGVFAIREKSTWGYQENKRFAYCSTFKWVLGAAVLKEIENGKLKLSQSISYSKKDLLPYSAVTAEHVSQGAMTVGELSAAAIQESDNAAANLLSPLVGNLAGLKSFVQSRGDTVMRFDRPEPQLNSNLPGDEQDTTSPKAMTLLLQKVLEGNQLSKVSQTQLTTWLKGATTGMKRIRAAVNPTWVVGDKTGTGDHGATNDLAVIYPEKGAPIYLTVFTSGTDADRAAHEKAIVAVTKVVLESLAHQ